MLRLLGAVAALLGAGHNDLSRRGAYALALQAGL